MNFFKYILNTIFGKSKKQEEFNRVQSREDLKMEVVHKKETASIIGGYSSQDTKCDKSKSCGHIDKSQAFCEPNFTPRSYGSCNPPANIPNGDYFFASKELLEKENKTDSKIIGSVKSQKNKRVVGQDTLAKIKSHLLEFGSINTITCEEKFKVKSLRNFIWFLRSEGFIIKTYKVTSNNTEDDKKQFTNYVLIPQE